MAHFVVLEEAQEDLREIARYTEAKWGAAQARRYAAQLDACFNAIADGHPAARRFSAHDLQQQVVRCEHHFVFFLTEEMPIIIAVFHERMDLLARLKQRLQTE